MPSSPFHAVEKPLLHVALDLEEQGIFSGCQFSKSPLNIINRCLETAALSEMNYNETNFTIGH